MHPLVKILYFILILAVMGYLSEQFLYVLFALICMATVVLQFHHFWHVIKRMRWLFLSILVIYAFATPGEFIPNIPVNIAPTIEGVHQGILQVMRLLIALAALTLLYANSSKAQLILGLYMLLKPLKCLGLNVEKFAVRLMLTLEYVEELALQDNRRKFGFEQIDAIALADETLENDKVLALTAVPLNARDHFLMLVLLILVLTFLIFKYQSLGSNT